MLETKQAIKQIEDFAKRNKFDLIEHRDARRMHLSLRANWAFEDGYVISTEPMPPAYLWAWCVGYEAGRYGISNGLNG